LGEGSAFAGFDVSDLDRDPERVLMLDHIAGTDFIAVDFHAITCRETWDAVRRTAKWRFPISDNTQRQAAW
jgi:hypothetical protein